MTKTDKLHKTMFNKREIAITILVYYTKGKY